jgi:hypothetical protein
MFFLLKLSFILFLISLLLLFLLLSLSFEGVDSLDLLTQSFTHFFKVFVCVFHLQAQIDDVLIFGAHHWNSLALLG